MSEIETVTIDTHAMVKDMVAAGFTEEMAEANTAAITKLVTSNLATKYDIALVNERIEQLRKDTTSEIESLRKDTKTEIEILSRDLTIRMGSMTALSVGLIVGILSAIKFLG